VTLGNGCLPGPRLSDSEFGMFYPLDERRSFFSSQSILYVYSCVELKVSAGISIRDTVAVPFVHCTVHKAIAVSAEEVQHRW